MIKKIKERRRGRQSRFHKLLRTPILVLCYNRSEVFMRKILKLLKSKAFYIVTSLLLQIIAIIFIITYFSTRFQFFYFFMLVLSTIIAIHVCNRESDSSSKLLWVFLILSVPVFGGITYLLFGGRKIPKVLMSKDRQAYSDYKRYALQNIKTLEKTNGEDYTLDKMISMAWSNGYFPVYEDCKTKYFESGEVMYKSIMDALKSAKKFIFIETFILDQGNMWDEILAVLLEKVNEGLDVRLIYDDFGTITHLKEDYETWLNAQGIRTYSFNKIRPQLAVQMNNRDHRKMIIIDGFKAYTGGINIADEYINTKERFGYWKDMGIMIEGKGVEMFTISFLQIWNYQSHENSQYDDFLLPDQAFEKIHGKGYIIPFSDSPTDDANPGKNMHLNMLNGAVDYFWITTPYLVLDAEMIDALVLAVNNGVDVRIVVPGIPDKKLVYEVTKSNYEYLIKKGVKIYEYTPGFIHGKVCLSDGQSALVGTVNMDFRSYYTNYECGIWLYKTECLPAIKKDLEQIFKDSHPVTYEECRNVNPFVRYYRNILRIFSPLM